MKLAKLINFESEKLIEEIQRYANQNYNGNFNKAVRELCAESLNQGKNK